MCDKITNFRYPHPRPLFFSVDAIAVSSSKNKGHHSSKNKTQQQLPTPMFLLGPNLTFAQNAVVAVTAGTYHSLAVTQSGQVYVWGSGKHGRLGLGIERVALR